MTGGTERPSPSASPADPADLALLVGGAGGYLLGGYVVFGYATRRARRLGVLGDY